MKKILVFLFAILTTYFNSSGQNYWTQPLHSFYQTFDMVCDGNNFYISTPGGVFRSTDNGNSWWLANNGLTNDNGLTNKYISSLFVNGNSIIAGAKIDGTYTNDGIYQSTNGGNSWAPLASWPSTYISDFEAIGNNLFAATNGSGIFLTTDNGVNWTAVNNGLPYLGISCLAVNDNVLFAGTFGRGLYKTTDNGANWVGAGLPDWLFIYGLAEGAGDIYAFTNWGNYMTTNNGLNWSGVNIVLNAVSLAIDGNNLYAGTSTSEIYISSDRGANWTLIGSGFTSNTIDVIFVKNNLIFAGTNKNSYFVSTNGGSTWTKVSSGLWGDRVGCILVNGDDVFVNAYGVCIYQQTGVLVGL